MDKRVVENGVGGVPHQLAYHKAVPKLGIPRNFISGSPREVCIAKKELFRTLGFKVDQLKIYSHMY
jgi:hypothetical protein